MIKAASIAKLAVNTAATVNLIRNPSGKDGQRGWGLGGANASSGLSVACAEDGYAWAWGAAASGATAQLMASTAFAVTAGNILSVSAAVTALGTRNLTIRAAYYDSTGALISVSGIYSANVGTGTSSVGTTGVVPTAATTAQVVIGSASTGAVPAMYAAKIMVICAASSASNVYVPDVWTDISGTVGTINTESGPVLNGVEDTPTVGSLVAVLRSATLDPATGNTTLYRGRPIRLRTASGVDVWRGVIESVTTAYEPDGDVIITVTATDALRQFNTTVGNYRDVTNAATQTSDTGVNWLANVCGADYATPIMPDTSTFPSIVASDDGATGLDWLRRFGNSNPTTLPYVAADGYLDFADGSPAIGVYDTTPNVSPAGIAKLSYTGIDVARGVDFITNQVTVTRYATNEDGGMKDYGPYTVGQSAQDNGAAPATLQMVGYAAAVNTSGSPAAAAQWALATYAAAYLVPSEIRLNTTPNADVVATNLKPYGRAVVRRGTMLADVTFTVMRVKHAIDGDKWLTTFNVRPVRPTSPTVAYSSPAAGASTGASDQVDSVSNGLFRVAMSGTQSIPASTETVVLWPDTPSIKDGGIVTKGSDGKLTVNKDGRYLVTASLGFPSNSTATRRVIAIAKNGTKQTTGRINAWSGGENTVSAADMFKLASGDALTVIAFHAASAAVAIGGDVTTSNISITYLGT